MPKANVWLEAKPKPPNIILGQNGKPSMDRQQRDANQIIYNHWIGLLDMASGLDWQIRLLDSLYIEIKNLFIELEAITSS